MKIDCRAIAERMKEKIKEKCAGRGLRFGIVQVGDNPASNAYIKGKLKDCAEVGIEASVFKYDEEIPQEVLMEKITSLVNSHTLDALIIQLPLPEHLCLKDLVDLIPSEMDVDNLKGTSPFIPATPKGILMLLDYLGRDLCGKHLVMIGRSKIVGEPMAVLATGRNATVSLCHSKTPSSVLRELCQSADIIVSAVGKRDFIGKDMINTAKRQLLLDVGINRDDEGKLCGDANSQIYDIETLDYTPVPGGIGLMTRVGLLENISSLGKGERRGISNEK